MKRTLLTALLSAISAAVFCQPSVTVTSEPGADNSLAFYGDVSGYGIFTVQLIFSRLENARKTEQVFYTTLAGPGKNHFLDISPADSSKPVMAEYSYNWLQGELDPAVQEDFVYRLPFGKGRNAVPVLFRGDGPMSPDMSNFIVWEFPLVNGDIVFAARAGQVIRTQVDGDPEYASYGTVSANNKITIQHADGTMAEYSFLAAGSLLVTEGDLVKPDTPIARAGGNEEGKYAMRMAVYNYCANKGNDFYNGFALKRHIDPVFATGNGNIKLTEGEMITAKVTKRLISNEQPRRSFWKRLFCKK